MLYNLSLCTFLFVFRLCFSVCMHWKSVVHNRINQSVLIIHSLAPLNFVKIIKTRPFFNTCLLERKLIYMPYWGILNVYLHLKVLNKKIFPLFFVSTGTNSHDAREPADRLIRWFFVSFYVIKKITWHIITLLVSCTPPYIRRYFRIE